MHFEADEARGFGGVVRASRNYRSSNDGGGPCRRLIKQRCPDLPVLMVTAYGDDERRRHARGLGAFDFVTKPVDFDHLKAQLRQATRRRPLITFRAP